MARRAYIARYPTPNQEIILFSDTHWSAELNATFQRLAENFKKGDDPIQAWYADDNQTNFIGDIR